MKNYTITVNGNVYDVVVEEGATTGAAPVAAPKAVAPVAAPKAAAAGCTQGQSPLRTPAARPIRAPHPGRNRRWGSWACPHRIRPEPSCLPPGPTYPSRPTAGLPPRRSP